MSYPLSDLLQTLNCHFVIKRACMLHRHSKRKPRIILDYPLPCSYLSCLKFLKIFHFSSLPVVNAAYSTKVYNSLQKLNDLCVSGCFKEFPLGRKMLFPPGVTYSKCRLKIKLYCFLFQLLPAMILDFLLSMSGKKKRFEF